MFCPQCGQQAADEIRFCPRCGLSLMPHAALLAGHQTAAAASPIAPPQPPALTHKRVNKRRGAKMIFFSLVLFPVFLIMSFAVDEPVPLLVPFLLFFTGLAWWLYAKLFGDDTPVAQHAAGRDLQAGGERPALGAPQFVPASLFNRPHANTSEISPPASVTESTTKLLDKDA